MSEKDAQTLGEAVAANVRRWRAVRGLDQQGLADRLHARGWPVDRTTVNRLERGARKVTVDDLGMLAAALQVPLPVLLLPIHEGRMVAVAPDGPTELMHPWQLWEWMRGEQSLDVVDAEWRRGAEPLWLYESVRAAQLDLDELHRSAIAEDDPRWREALQALVDSVAEMNAAGYPADDLIAKEWGRAIKRHGLTPRPRRGRYGSVEEVRKAAGAVMDEEV
jgi:transcriptional regulator with XRE-family HTH domain